MAKNTKQTVGPAAHLPTVRKAHRAWMRAIRAEEEATTYAQSCRLAHCTQKALNVLRAAQNGVAAPTTPRVAAARAGFHALATFGRAIARGVQCKAALAKAAAANVLRAAARKVRRAMRAALRLVVVAALRTVVAARTAVVTTSLVQLVLALFTVATAATTLAAR